MPNTMPIASLLFVSVATAFAWMRASALAPAPANRPRRPLPPHRAVPSGGGGGDESPLQARVGFVGCGTIAHAMATGLLSGRAPGVGVESVRVTRRSEARSRSLAAAFPGLVTVHSDGQEVLDGSDLVFLCVLPEQTSDVLQRLTFDPDRHTLISLASTTTLEQLARGSGLPPHRIFRCICLPAVARGEGLCLLTPPCPPDADPALKPLLKSLGGCVEASSQRQMAAMMVPSGLMGMTYGILSHARDWLVENGDVSRGDASLVVGRMFWSMLMDAERRCGEEDAFEELIAEQTPGGLNEQALNNMYDLGLAESLGDVQHALFARILGESDGSLSNNK